MKENFDITLLRGAVVSEEAFDNFIKTLVNQDPIKDVQVDSKAAS